MAGTDGGLVYILQRLYFKLRVFSMKDVIDIKINGEKREIPAGSSLQHAVKEYECSAPFAVTVNNVLVTKAQYSEYALRSGDVVDIVYPMQGG
ncbi:MAG: sulfur carrier protein ThiS [Anaplasma ovis]|nr:sulfur carrier protein ThiS [Anaplasma ovis]